MQVVTQREAGGAQSVACLLHRELLARGLDSELWFLFAKSAAFKDEPGVMCLSQSRPTLFESPRLLLSVAKRLMRKDVGAVITHTHYANVIVAPIAKICGIKCRVAVHHNAVMTYPRTVRIIEYLWKKAGIYSVSIAVSDDVKESLVRWKPQVYAGTVRRVYNGLPARSRQKPCGVGSELGAPLATNLLFNVGRLTAQKNHEALVKALVDLPDCTAVVAGEGPLRGQLVEMARKLGVTDRFRLLGEITSAEVERWMRASAVFVFPSRYEAMPMALLEAMRAGMAIVASDIPAHREVAGGAVLLSSTSPLLLATTIQSALRQRNNGNPLGLLAKERSAQFTAEAMTDGYLELL